MTRMLHFYLCEIAELQEGRIAEREGKPLDEDGSLTMEHPLADSDWAVRHLLQYGPEVDVLEPDEIREAIKRRLEAIGAL